MPANQKIVPSSSNKSSSSSSTEPSEHNLESIILSSFKVKPAGTRSTRITLLENDSLSSYSWPEETAHQSGSKQNSGEKATNRASGDLSEKREHGSSKSHTVIDIENGHHSDQLRQPTYVESYMRFMYWTCVSPFNPTGRWNCPRQTWFELVLKFIQKVAFSTIIGFSLVKSFFQVKFNLLYYMAYPDLENFIDMMFYVMNTGTKLYYVYMFVFLQTRFSQMLTDLDKLRAFRMPISPKSNTPDLTMQYSVKLGVSSIVMTFVQTILYSGVVGWTPSKGILAHSYGTALGLFLWSKENMGNETWYNSMEYEYKDQINATNILLGTLGLVLHFCSFLHIEATSDMMQTQAETVWEEMQCLENRINRRQNDEQNITLNGFFRENGEWAHSRFLTQAITSCNNTLDPIMKYKHVNNLMLYVFFVLNFLDGDYSLAFLACLLYGICKSSYTYRIAAEASTLNAAKHEWIRRLAWKSSDDEFKKSVPLLLDEIKENPIGMGKGQFLINESFIYRFLGWVGSVFVLQAQSREAKMD